MQYTPLATGRLGSSILYKYCHMFSLCITLDPFYEDHVFQRQSPLESNSKYCLWHTIDINAVGFAEKINEINNSFFIDELPLKSSLRSQSNVARLQVLSQAEYFPLSLPFQDFPTSHMPWSIFGFLYLT